MSNNGNVIVVVSIDGYAKHDMPARISELMARYESDAQQSDTTWGRHEIYWNSEGYQLTGTVNYPIPDGTNEFDVWNEIWDIQNDMYTGDEVDARECILIDPVEFTVDGQRYLYLGNMWGYYHDSTSPDDDRYES